MGENHLEQAILELVGRPGYRPVKPRMIARQLRVSQGQVDEVKQAIKRLMRRKALVYGPGHLVMPPVGPQPVEGATCGPDCVVGVFRRTGSGYGFVRPSGAPAGQQPRDIYVASRDAADAATGDTVAVRLLRGRGRFPGPRGEIVEILERQTHQFVGTCFQSGGEAYVEVDGAVFAQPIAVGDARASGVRSGDKVVFEMVRFPSHYRDGEGVIVEILGPRGKPGVDTLSIIREFGLPDEFPQDALDQARREAEQFVEAVPAGRLDATEQTVVTIDPIDARDFDDAISLEQSRDGQWRLGVHIADVAHFVRPNTALDREARNRATSVYLPDRVIPMLPEILSNGLASLQPGKIRFTKTVYLDFTPDGLRLGAEFHASAIRSAKRLTYEQVDAFLANPEPFRKRWGAKVHDLLLRMHLLAMLLRRRRFQHGALELMIPEVKIELDAHGRVAGAHVIPYTASRQIIEEFMLAANEAVAEMLCDKGIPFLRRIHKPPSLYKLRALTEFVRALGFRVDSLQNRFALQELLGKVAARPEAHAVNYAVLRSLQRAEYSPEEEGHYALASPCYCHFTSPIRRYPDLTVHRLVDAVVRGRKPPTALEELPALGEHCSQREQRAEAAERELVRVKLLAYLSGRIGQEMDAVVTGVERFGLFVQGVELPAEGLIRVESLTDDYYDFDRSTHSLTGRRSGSRFRLGDLLRVSVARVDVDRRELDFRLITPRQQTVAAGAGVGRGEKAPPRKRGREGARRQECRRNVTRQKKGR